MANAANEEAKRFSMECIETALLSLMSEKPYDKITYQELAGRAGVSRNAIYRNYSSVDDILSQYLFRITGDFLHSFDRTMAYKDYLLVLFRHLAKTKDVGMLLLKAGKASILYNTFLLMKNRYNVENDNIREYYDYYRIGGIYCVYLHWLETGCRETADELCAIVLQVMQIYGITPM